jgi:hypothetical protein
MTASNAWGSQLATLTTQPDEYAFEVVIADKRSTECGGVR